MISINSMNIDFELNLAENSFTDNPKKRTLREEFEYLIWWLSDGAILTHKYYSPEYLEHLKSYGLKTLTSTDSQQKEVSDFWAKSPQDLKQRVLNSKRENAKILNQLQVNAAQFLIPEVMNELESFATPMWIRDEFSFSGSGTLAIREKSDLLYFKAKLRSKLNKILVAPLFKPIEEFGALVDRDGSYSIHRNIIDYAGQYKGSAFEKKFEQTIDHKLHAKINAIISHYHEQTFDHWGIDFFRHSEIDYHFCEMNHRKTMGLIGKLLWKKYFSEHNCFALFLLPQRTLHFLQDLKQLQERIDLPQVTIFSPLGNQYLVYGITDNTLSDVLELNEELKARIVV